jgi:pimeloyl-ACP methyl ester carboxylesterase
MWAQLMRALTYLGERYTSTYYNMVFRAPPLLPSVLAEDVNRKPEDQRARPWELLHPSEGRSMKALVFFCHDCNVDVDRVRASLQRLADECAVGVVAYEYPGYGGMRRPRSTPAKDAQDYRLTSARASDLKRDALVAFDAALADRKELPVILIGHGFGCGLAMHLLGQRSAVIKDVCLVNGFASMSAFIRHKLPSAAAYFMYLLEPNAFDNIREASAIVPTFSGAVLLIHGRQNTLFPLAHAQRLRDAIATAAPTASVPAVRILPAWDHHVPWKTVQKREVLKWVHCCVGQKGQ